MTALDRPTTATTGRRRTTRVLVVVAILMSLAPFTMDMYLPAMPQMAEDLGTTPSRIQLSLTGVLIGLAVGQLLVGPLADAVGRRRPALIGLACHVVVSLLCFLASDALLLAGLRVLQGLSVAAVAVVSMATVRDLFAGAGYARVMSRMFLVIGIAPVVAPGVGGALLTITEWPTIFLALAAYGVLLLAVAYTMFPETLAPENRGHATLAAVRASYGALLRDPTYLAIIIVGGMMFSTLFSYVGGSSFVLQGRFDMSPQQFTLAFAANAVGLTVTAQLNPMLIGRFGPARVLTGATTLGVAGSALLLGLFLSDDPPLAAVLASLAVIVAGYGLSMPNSQALALARQGHRAATAAALMGCSQFVIGSIVTPLVGLGGADGVAMAAAMLAATTVAATVMWLVVRRHVDTMSLR